MANCTRGKSARFDELDGGDALLAPPPCDKDHPNRGDTSSVSSLLSSRSTQDDGPLDRCLGLEAAASLRGRKVIARAVSLDAAQVLAARSRASAYRGPGPAPGAARSALMRRDRSLPVGEESRDGVDVSTCSDRSGSDGRRSDPQVRTCSFSSVNVREYERVAGDHPAVTRGVPLAIGWGYRQYGSVDLEEFEQMRGPPRNKSEMRVPPVLREEILRDEHGVPDHELAESLRAVSLAKRQRERTARAEPLEGLAEAAECARRRLRRLCKGTSKGQEEARLWEEARRRAKAGSRAGNGSSRAAPEGAGLDAGDLRLRE